MSRARRVGSSHVEIVWFDEVGHFAQIEAPEAFQRALTLKLAP
jgi:pimeloyl-ACP methyl ester carboxylesterase